jgi:hypothetical protein
MQTEDMVEQLVSLLLPIDSLLSRNIFDTEAIQAMPMELVNLFRNMWFLSTLFQFTAPDEKEGSAMQWQRPALMHIAVKTPPLVSEEAGDALGGEIEYNPVIRQEYAQHVRRLRLALSVIDRIAGNKQASRSTEQAHRYTCQRDTSALSRPRHISIGYA